MLTPNINTKIDMQLKNPRKKCIKKHRLLKNEIMKTNISSEWNEGSIARK